MTKTMLFASFFLLISCAESPLSVDYSKNQATYCYENRLVKITDNLTCLDGLVCLVEDLETNHRQLADVNHLEQNSICN